MYATYLVYFQEIISVLKDIACDESLRKYECLAVCVMSHGQQGAILGTDGRRVAIDDIVNTFANNNCPFLMGKPKIFLMQSCRGGDKHYDKIFC